MVSTTDVVDSRTAESAIDSGCSDETVTEEQCFHDQDCCCVTVVVEDYAEGLKSCVTSVTETVLEEQ